MNLTNQKTRRKAAFLLAVGLLEAASPVFAAPMVSITHEQEAIVLNVQGTTIEGFSDTLSVTARMYSPTTVTYATA